MKFYIKFELIGALTSKQYSFISRPWELINNISLDFFEPFNNFIKMEVRFNKILRILPINSNFWITDKIRYFFDALYINKNIKPFFNNNVGWFYISNKINNYFVQNNSKVLINKLNLFLDIKFFFNFKKISQLFNVSYTFFKKENLFFNFDFYLSNFDKNINIDTYIKSLKINSEIFLYFCNIRYESPNLNLLIKKSSINFNLKINYIGFFPSYINYKFNFFGFGFKNFYNIFNGRFNNFNNFIKNTYLFIFGNSFFNMNLNIKNNFFSFFIFIKKYFKNFNFYILSQNIFEFNILNFFNPFNKEYFKKNFKIFNNFFFNYFIININNKLSYKVKNNFDFIKDFYITLFPKIVNFYSFNTITKYSNCFYLPILTVFEYDILFENFFGIKQKIMHSIKPNNNYTLWSNVNFIFEFIYFLKFRYFKNKKSIINYFNFKIINFKTFNSFYYFFYYSNFINFNFINFNNNFFFKFNYPKSIKFNYYISDYISKNSLNLNLINNKFYKNKINFNDK